MSFPTNTTILDNFNRSNGVLTGGNFTQNTYGEAGDFEILSNQIYNPDPGHRAEYVWNAATFGPQVDCFMTIVATGTDNVSLAIKKDDLGGVCNSYDVWIDFSESPDSWTLGRNEDTDTYVQLGAAFTQNVSAGDSMGLQYISGMLKAWYKPSAGSWTELASRNDTTFQSQSGYSSFYGNQNTTWRYDDLGGGTVVAGGTVYASKRGMSRGMNRGMFRGMGR